MRLATFAAPAAKLDHVLIYLVDQVLLPLIALLRCDIFHGLNLLDLRVNIHEVTDQELVALVLVMPVKILHIILHLLLLFGRRLLRPLSHWIICPSKEEVALHRLTTLCAIHLRVRLVF